MKYIISVEGSISKHLSEILTHELARFDIRAEIQTLEMNKRIISKALRDFYPDLLIAIGSKRSSSVIRLANKQGIKTCFFYQSLFDKNIETVISTKANKTFIDLPIINSSTYVGSLFYEFIRKQESSLDDYSQNTLISIPASGPMQLNRALKLTEVLNKQMQNVAFKTVEVSSDLPSAVEIAKKSNALIALDQFSSMIAVLTNCPQINVYQSSLLKRSNNIIPFSNKLLGKDAISSYSITKIDSIVSELERILNDHQYCAGILENYQEVKSILGTSPFARRVAQEIVEQLEDTD